MKVQTVQRLAKRLKKKKNKKSFISFRGKIARLLLIRSKDRFGRTSISTKKKESRGSKILLSEKGRKIWRKIFFFLSIFLPIQIIFEILVLPFLNIQFIEIKGTEYLDQEEVLMVAGIQGKEYYFSLNEKALAKRIEELAWVRKVQVTKVFPNRLKILVQEREPVFLHLIDTEEARGSVPILLDDEGIAFAIGREALSFDLPILSGVMVRGLDLKSQFPIFLRRLFQEVGALKQRHKFLYDLISEVYVESKWGGGSFDLSLYLINTPLVFQLSSHLNEEKMMQVLLSLDMLEKNKTASSITHVDLRGNEAVYRYRRE